MKYVRFTGGNGFAGCEYEEYQEYNDDTPDYIIEEDALMVCEENAESFAYMRFGDDPYTDEEFADYVANDCYFDWEYITEEEFDASY